MKQNVSYTKIARSRMLILLKQHVTEHTTRGQRYSNVVNYTVLKQRIEFYIRYTSCQ